MIYALREQEHEAWREYMDGWENATQPVNMFFEYPRLVAMQETDGVADTPEIPVTPHYPIPLIEIIEDNPDGLYNGLQ